jgi:hypothetical protein
LILREDVSLDTFGNDFSGTGKTCWPLRVRFKNGSVAEIRRVVAFSQQRTTYLDAVEQLRRPHLQGRRIACEDMSSRHFYTQALVPLCVLVRLNGSAMPKDVA